MKKSIVLIIAVLFGMLYSNTVSQEKAKSLAQNWYKHLDPQSKNNSNVKSINSEEYKGVTPFYTFSFENGGFVIVSADDDVYPILGYSLTSISSKDSDNAEFKSWLNSYKEQIFSIKSKKLSNNDNKKLWKNYLNNEFEETKGSRTVAPLLTTEWGQTGTFNTYCPENANMPNGRTATGCTATAVAQVMKFHSYPEKGQGNYTYRQSNITLSVDFSKATYEWDKMPDWHSTNLEPAEISYHVGVALESVYGPYGTGAWFYKIPNAIKTYFKYDDSAREVKRSDYNNSDWHTLIKNELDNNRPVLYAGSGALGGHAFVCVGYQNTDFFHFNWGWVGDHNGYFYANNLTIGNFSFNDDQTAIISVMPLPEKDWFRIFPKHTRNINKGLDIDHAFVHNGANIQNWFVWGGDNQQFAINDAGDGYFWIEPKHIRGKCIDINDWATWNDGNVHMWDYYGNPNQLWRAEDVGGGYYKIISKHSNKVLDMDIYYGDIDGANLHIWDYWGGDNQKWTLVYAGSSRDEIDNPFKKSADYWESNIEDELQITNYKLKQNYPNPFNPVTKINYELAITNYESASIVVYNATGQSVWASKINPSQNFIEFNGSKFNSGVYYYSLVIDGKQLSTKKMILTK